MIKEGERVPDAEVFVMQGGKPTKVSTAAHFKGKKVVLFGVPGAFTPTCSEAHLPGYVVNADAIKAKGVDEIICMSVNDAFVMDSWGQARNAEQLTMMADGNGALTAAMGLEMDGSGFGLGTRCQRFALVAEDGAIKKLAVEAPGKLEVSAAEAILAAL